MPKKSGNVKKGKEKPSFLDSETAAQIISNETENSENKRGLVLVCGAIIDRSLEKLLRMKFAEMAPSAATEEELDFWFSRKPLPPFGSFGIRAQASTHLRHNR